MLESETVLDGQKRLTGEQKRHLARIRTNLIEMRRCLRESERARDTFYKIRDEYREVEGLRGAELDIALTTNTKAKAAVADNVMYDRWATKYAGVVQTEISAFQLGIHADKWLEEINK
jgi:hypothetical protein